MLNLLRLLAILTVAAPLAAKAGQYAVVDSTGLITNIIVADPTFPAPAGMSMVPVPGPSAIIGGSYLNGTFTPPPAPTPPPKTYNFLGFMNLFTHDEQATIVSSADPQVKILVLMALSTKSISMSDPQMKTGLDYLVSIGILTVARETVLLGS